MIKKITFLAILFTSIIYAQDYGEQIIEQPVQNISHAFGHSVSIDGDYAVVGAPNENNQTGAANVFKKDNNGNWVHIQKITAFVGQSEDEYFGTTVHIKGNFIFIAAPKDRLDEVRFEGIAGSVMIYKNNGADNFVGVQRIRSTDISAGDNFGNAIDSYGDFLVVGADSEDEDALGNNTLSASGSAYVFKKDGVNDQWNQIQKLVPNHREAFDFTGKSIAMYNKYIILGSGNDTDEDNLNPLNGNGSVFVFEKDAVNDVWTETQKLKASDDNGNSSFGYRGIDVYGNYISVGATGVSSVYLFKVNNADGVWSQIQKVNATGFSTSSFGANVSLNGDFFIASAPSASVQQLDGTNIASGTAFIFKNNNDTWNQIAQIAPSDGELNDFYGGGTNSYTPETTSAIDFDGIHFIIGAAYNDITVGANTFNDAGKAYISGNFTGLFGQTATWTGAVSTDWNTAGNWDINAVPTQNDNVILADVANAPRINFNQSYTVKNLTNDGVLTIKTNASLTVLENLDHKNTIIVESFVNGNGSFILKGNQINANPQKLTYFRYVSGNTWHMISSPVENQDIDVFAGANPLAEGQNNNRGIGFHHKDGVEGWSYYQDGAINSGNFLAGKGYSLNVTANSFLRFDGIIKDDNLSNYPISDNYDKWNLVGNPYPAFINANTNANLNENFLTENADNLDPAFANIYLWNPNTTSYEPVGNGLEARYIAPGQGFFLRAKNGGGTIDINKSMLTHQTGSLFLKENTIQKIVLNVDNNTTISETTIAFKNGMTKGLNVTYDAAVFNGDSRNLYLYSKLLNNSNIPFAIQFLPEISDNQYKIPIGIKSDSKINLKLSFKTNISSDIHIVLEDRKQNTFTKISDINSYIFDYEVEDEENRFYLHIQNKALNIPSSETKKIILYKDSEASIIINGVDSGVLNIYSISGKKVMKNRKIKNTSQQIKLPNFAKGVYLFEVKTNSNKIVKKIIF